MPIPRKLCEPLQTAATNTMKDSYILCMYPMLQLELVSTRFARTLRLVRLLQQLVSVMLLEVVSSQLPCILPVGNPLLLLPNLLLLSESSRVSDIGPSNVHSIDSGLAVSRLGLERLFVVPGHGSVSDSCTGGQSQLGAGLVGIEHSVVVLVVGVDLLIVILPVLIVVGHGIRNRQLLIIGRGEVVKISQLELLVLRLIGNSHVALHEHVLSHRLERSAHKRARQTLKAETDLLAQVGHEPGEIGKILLLGNVQRVLFGHVLNVGFHGVVMHAAHHTVRVGDGSSQCQLVDGICVEMLDALQGLFIEIKVLELCVEVFR